MSIWPTIDGIYQSLPIVYFLITSYAVNIYNINISTLFDLGIWSLQERSTIFMCTVQHSIVKIDELMEWSICYWSKKMSERILSPSRL